MPTRIPFCGLALIAALGLAGPGAQAFDGAKYPDWSGAWVRIGSGSWHPDKPRGRGQEVPLTAEYQAVLDASLADQERGGQGNDPGYRCSPHGMPRAMIGIQPFQFVVLPETTYVLHELFNQLRRIYTDGRDWPATLRHTSIGHSIGKWEDTDGDGRYDTLVVETRGLKNPRSYDSSGIPFHKDDRTIVLERIRLDRSKPDLLTNEVTTMDNALTRPWTVTRTYSRWKEPTWVEFICSEDNRHVVIGSENYIVNNEGLLMPVRKGQAAPDLKHFATTAP
jgi:hypothetical protein